MIYIICVSVAQWITHPSPKGKIAGSNPVRDEIHVYEIFLFKNYLFNARLAQMVERATLNRVVAGSIPAVGVSIYLIQLASIDSSMVEFVPSKHEARVRFPVDALIQ